MGKGRKAARRTFKQYPREMPPIKVVEAQDRPYFVDRVCDGGCGRVFNILNTVYVIETQVSPMRGDDEVKGYCPKCFGKG